MHMASEPFRYAKLTSAAAARFFPSIVLCAAAALFLLILLPLFCVSVHVYAQVLDPHIPRASFMERDVADSG